MRALNIPRSQSSVKCFVAATPAFSPRLWISGITFLLSGILNIRSDALRNTKRVGLKIVDIIDF